MNELHHLGCINQSWLKNISFFLSRLIRWKSNYLHANAIKLIVVLTVITGIPTSNVLASWSWSFNEEVINLAIEQQAFITFTNDESSDGDLWVTAIDNTSFGSFGLLFEPGFVGIIIPTSRFINQVLSPGETSQALAIVFFLIRENLPTPGVIYEISPNLLAVVGTNCDSELINNCVFAEQNPTRLLTLTYVPVPEPTAITLFFAWFISLSIWKLFARVRKNFWQFEPKITLRSKFNLIAENH